MCLKGKDKTDIKILDRNIMDVSVFFCNFLKIVLDTQYCAMYSNMRKEVLRWKTR